MADTQTLAALQEILLNARIRFTSGAAAQWSSANPVLLKGEVGFVEGTSPAQFKIGDGTKTWSALGWGNTTGLWQLDDDPEHRLVTDDQIYGWSGKADKTAATTTADGLMSKSDKAKLDGVAAGANNYTHPASHPATMIAQDATHRFVSDTEKTAWNKKGDAIEFDYDAYLKTATAAAQKQIVKDIFNAVSQGRKCVVTARNILVPNSSRAIMVDGMVWFYSVEATEVTGLVKSFAWDSSDNNKTLTLITAIVTFKSDGTVSIVKTDLTPRLLTPAGLPSYTLEKVATESGFASTYHLKKDGQKVGASINIPLDQVLRGSSIKSVTTAGAPYTGAKVGDKYIEFLFQNNSTPQYLPVQDLVDVYTGDGSYIQVSSTNIIQLNYAALKTKLQTDFGSVFDAKGAGAAAARQAVDDFKASSFVIQCTVPGMN